MRHHTVWNLFWDWSRVIDRANYAKKDPEKRQKTKRFGIFAVIYAVLAAACACALLLFRYLGKVWLVTSLLCISLAVGIGIVGTLVCLITTFVYWFCQLSINKRAVTWISLALILAVLGFGGAFVFMMF